MKLVILLSRKKNARGEDALESLHKPSVMQTVLGQLQEIEHLGSAYEPNGPASLYHSQSGHAYWDKAVLTEWDSQRELHLRTVRFWDGQKSLILSTHYVANVSKSSRSDA